LNLSQLSVFDLVKSLHPNAQELSYLYKSTSSRCGSNNRGRTLISKFSTAWKKIILNIDFGHNSYLSPFSASEIITFKGTLTWDGHSLGFQTFWPRLLNFVPKVGLGVKILHFCHWGGIYTLSACTKYALKLCLCILSIRRNIGCAGGRFALKRIDC